jgi:hypothetical protein
MSYSRWRIHFPKEGTPLSMGSDATNGRRFRLAVTGLLVIGAVGAWAILRPKPASNVHLDPPDVLRERVVQGPTVEVRAEAASDLVRHDEAAHVQSEVHSAVAEYHGTEPEVLVPLARAVAKQRDWRSLPRMFDLMEHPDPKVRGKAGAAVKVICGADYGFRAEDPPAKRQEALRRIRAIQATMVPKLEEFYSKKVP